MRIKTILGKIIATSIIYFVSLLPSSLKAQKLTLDNIDSLKSYIVGTWQLSKDSNVIWLFKDRSNSYTFYAHEAEYTDSNNYRILDTNIVVEGTSKVQKGIFLVIKNKHNISDIDYWKIIGLNKYYMYLEAFPQEKYADFSKVDLK